MTERQTHTIDDADRILGRLATEIAVLLRGKHKPGFQPNQDCGDFVVIKNVGRIKVSGNKMEQKKYYSHSGYPGALKVISFKKLFESQPQEVLRKTVFGMLPTNKLRSIQIKRLKFE